MDITAIGTTSPVTRLHGSTANTPIAQSSLDTSFAPSDTVEISDTARWLGEIKQLPEVRQNKIDAARQAIANGTLDTPENLSAATDAAIQDHLDTSK